MKKTLLFLTIATLMTTGCSKTWSGIKQDSHEILVDTKEVIHNATEPETYVNASGRLVNPINNPSVQVVDSTKVQSAQYAPASTNNIQSAQYTPASTNSAQNVQYTPVSRVQVFEDTPTVVNTAN